jgi:hypothetical protein
MLYYTCSDTIYLPFILDTDAHFTKHALHVFHFCSYVRGIC